MGHAVDTVMRELGGGFVLRRHNKENVRFRRCRLRHGTTSYMVRVGVLRIWSESPVSHNIAKGQMNFVV